MNNKSQAQIIREWMDTLNEMPMKPWSDRFPSWSKKGEFKARIVLAGKHGIKNFGDFTTNQIKQIEKEAKAKFAQMQQEHPTGLAFATAMEAQKYMRAMTPPNWPIEVERLDGWGARRDVNIAATDTVKEPSYDDVKIDDLGNGSFLVHVDATMGPMINVIKWVGYRASEAGFKIKNKLGKTLTDLSKFKSNGIIVFASRKEVDTILAHALSDRKHYDDPEKEHLSTPREKALYKFWGSLKVGDKVKVNTWGDHGMVGIITELDKWNAKVRSRDGVTKEFEHRKLFPLDINKLDLTNNNDNDDE